MPKQCGNGVVPQGGNGVVPQGGNRFVPQSGNGVAPQSGNGVAPQTSRARRMYVHIAYLPEDAAVFRAAGCAKRVRPRLLQLSAQVLAQRDESLVEQVFVRTAAFAFERRLLPAGPCLEVADIALETANVVVQRAVAYHLLPIHRLRLFMSSPKRFVLASMVPYSGTIDKLVAGTSLSTLALQWLAAMAFARSSMPRARELGRPRLRWNRRYRNVP
jgi:hypothetical protein